MDPKRRRSGRWRVIATMLLFSLCAVLIVGLAGQAVGFSPPASDTGLEVTAEKAKDKAKATGYVDVLWRGGKGSPAVTGEEKTASVEVAIFADKGEFIYRVFTPAGELHREVRAEVQRAVFSETTALACALVVSDQKWGGGGGGGGSGGGCGGDEGGCGSGGGCGGDEGGCGGDEGGCEGETHTTTAQPSSGEMGTSEMADSGMGGSGPGASGGGSRVGQYVVIQVKVTDGGTPARNGDELRWHWYSADYGSTIDVSNGWTGHLCPKTILGGNLVVH